MAETDPAAEDLQQGGWKRYEELRPDELAAREETSYGLALFPDLVADSAWPDARPPPEESRHPGVCASIPQIPCLRRWGRMPARLRPRGEEGLALLVEHVASIVHAYLSAPEGGSDPPSCSRNW